MSHPHHTHDGDAAMSHHAHHGPAVAAHYINDSFPGDTEGLPTATSPETIDLRHGDAFDLRIHPVRKQIGDVEVRMLGYNGSIPGPTMHVDQGSEITVHATNDGDVEATVHWHGLRLENRYDGVPEETQAPIQSGETFTYKVQFPDPGLYWYHPHIREDYGLEMGLYGTIIVDPPKVPAVLEQKVTVIEAHRVWRALLRLAGEPAPGPAPEGMRVVPSPRRVLEVTGLAAFIELRVDGLTARERGLPGKPAPDTFLAAAADLGVEPAQAVVFEDALSGVQAGRAGGFALVIGVDRVGQAEALAANGADVVVQDLEELL